MPAQKSAFFPYYEQTRPGRTPTGVGSLAALLINAAFPQRTSDPELSKLAPQALLNNQINKERWADEVLGNRLISICHLRSVFAKATADRFQIAIALS